MITRTDHERLDRGNRCNLIVEFIQYTFVHCSTACQGSVWQEPLDLLLEPVVGVGQVTWLPKEVELGEGAGEGLNGVVVARGERVRGTGADVGSQSFLRSISLVVGLKDVRRLTLPIVPISTTTAMV